MAGVSGIGTCPSCAAIVDASHYKEERCPECGDKLAKPEKTTPWINGTRFKFELPLTLQYKNELSRIGGLSVPEDEKRAMLTALRSEFSDVIAQGAHKNLLGLLQDTHLLMRGILHNNIDKSTIPYLLWYAAQIGDIAKSIQNYYATINKIPEI